MPNGHARGVLIDDFRVVQNLSIAERDVVSQRD